MSEPSRRPPAELLAFRTYIWKHNALSGKHRRPLLYLQEIISTPSTSPNAKYLAKEALRVMLPLGAAIKERIGP